VDIFESSTTIVDVHSDVELFRTVLNLIQINPNRLIISRTITRSVVSRMSRSWLHLVSKKANKSLVLIHIQADYRSIKIDVLFAGPA